MIAAYVGNRGAPCRNSWRRTRLLWWNSGSVREQALLWTKRASQSSSPSEPGNPATLSRKLIALHCPIYFFSVSRCALATWWILPCICVWMRNTSSIYCKQHCQDTGFSLSFPFYPLQSLPSWANSLNMWHRVTSSLTTCYSIRQLSFISTLFIHVIFWTKR
jgi:hypothetical protein